MADDLTDDLPIENTGPDFLYARTMDQITDFLTGEWRRCLQWWTVC